MKRLLILLAASLALAACDGDIQPTKAPVLDQTPQTDSAPKPAASGDQPANDRFSGTTRLKVAFGRRRPAPLGR
ncbi:immunogenic protein (bcsp31-1) [Mesorhizobium sp. LSJC255A00]|uniref:hypothetical protein n=1 Tax=Mesorhizobium sp. LSJC255A00 TaxID=1287313 RepID=UPI0003CE7E04|nr:hypothetical protein [Mesorhizobium sp. LSJC255A00]ESX17572.1 immunogenic protein (bcsp31-1) [Mesorhizobium sp. LSJC255A00]